MTTASAARRPTGAGALLLAVTLPFGLGYFLSYYLRSVNAVLAPHIIAELSLDATAIGTLTGVYFLAGAFALLPAAMALDRYGPRVVLMAELAVAALGCLVTLNGESFAALVLGRCLIGLGVAACLTTAIKAVMVWYPKDRWATGNGLVIGFGALGVIAASLPTQALVAAIGWRGVFAVLIGLATAAILLAAVAVPAGGGSRGAAEPPAATRDVVATVLRSAYFWRLAPIATTSLAVYFALQGLWVNRWMADVAGLSQDEIGVRLLALALAMSVGPIVSGAVGDHLSRRGVPLAVVQGTLMTALMATEAAIVLEVAPRAFWPWIALGFLGNSGALIYSQLSRAFPPAFGARVVALVVILNFLLAFAIQAGVGLILDTWGRDLAGRYPHDAYKAAFGLLVLVQAPLMAWFAFGPGRGQPRASA